MVDIRRKGPPLSEAAIIALEIIIGFFLPDSYRRFLLENNGGRPTLDADTIRINDLSGGFADIHEFFGIGLPLETSNIIWNWKSVEGRIGDRLLPVACDNGGCVFCISLSGIDRGSVMYCDLTFDDNDGTTYFVANDFDSFLEKIEPFTPMPNESQLN